MNKNQILILKGNILYTPNPDIFETAPDSYLIAENGIVRQIADKLPEAYIGCEVLDYTNRLIIPGFVDLHTHAPQFNQRGLGMDLELLDWLREYTFKEESRFGDIEYASLVYEKFAQELIRQGTTRSVVFATIHKESTELLFDIMAKKGLGAYVGKVNMDYQCHPALKEDTATSLRETEELIERRSGQGEVKPIVTPRFAITSTPQLLAGLGKLAAKYQVPVQSHLSENMDEVRAIAKQFPEQKEYYKVYDQYQLFGQTPTLMAHCIYLDEAAIACMRDNGVMAVHCPDSNLNLSSGIMQTRKLLATGIQVGLGSDVGAGHEFSIASAMLKSIQMSKIIYSQQREYKPLTLSEAFYLGTKGGGRFFGKVGSFEPGYACDALVIDDTREAMAGQTLVERLQRFIYTGNSGWIAARYAFGRELK